MAAHRYWRINWLTTRSSTYAGIGGVSLASVAGGATLTAPKTISSATAQSSQGGHGPEVPVNANAGNYWGSLNAVPQWWRADLGVAVEVATVTIHATSTINLYGPQAFSVDSSPDDSSWTTRQSFTASSWTGNTQQSFHLTTPVSARYWRISVSSTFGGSGNIVGISLVNFSGAFASSAQDTHPAYLPFSGNFWGNYTPASGTGWWAYDLGSSPADIVEVKLTDVSSDSGFAPLTWTLDYSDDAASWTTKKSFTSAAWSGGLNQTFDASTTGVTNVVTTQIGVEEWGSSNPAMQATQVGVEEWGRSLNPGIVTQVSAEHWAAASPAAAVTQALVEHWGTVSTISTQAVVTQVAVEHWITEAAVSTARKRRVVCVSG